MNDEIRLNTIYGTFGVKPINKRESILYKVNYQYEILGFSLFKDLHPFNPIKLPSKNRF